MSKLTFKDTPITNNNHFKEKTLCGGDTGGTDRNSGRKKGRLSKREERTGGEAIFIWAHAPDPQPAEPPTLNLLGPLTLEGAPAPG